MLIDGIGYFCNGTCSLFNRFPVGHKCGKFIVYRANVVMSERDDEHGKYVFKTTNDIHPGEELILDYGNMYFLIRNM